MTWKKKKGGPAGQEPQAEAGAAAGAGLASPAKDQKDLKWAVPLVVVGGGGAAGAPASLA